MKFVVDINTRTRDAMAGEYGLGEGPLSSLIVKIHTIVKTKLRSSMTQERLNALGTIFIY